MYNKPKQDTEKPPDAGPDSGKYIRIGIVVAIGLVIFALVANQGIILSLNVTEFEDKFTKPLY